MRFSRSLFACTALLGSLSFAHAAPAPAPAPAAQAPNPNMLIATVNNQKITVADLQSAASALPPKVSQAKPEVIIPLLIHQLIDQKSVQILAEKEKLSSKPEVKAAMTAAANNVLQNAYLESKVAPKLTDNALKAYYQSHYASKKPEEEVHARHILVDTEAKAKSIIAQLNKGADFAKISATESSDKGSGANGGDLGWFKRGDMVPDFSNAAFNLKSGKVSQTPIHTQYGWHVVEVIGTRTDPVPSFEQLKDQIRHDLVREEVRKIVEDAERKVKIVHYDNKGHPISTPAPKGAK